MIRSKNDLESKTPRSFWICSLCLFCSFVSFMVTEFSIATLVEVNSLESDHMKNVFLETYGNKLFPAETDAIDLIHTKFSCCGVGTTNPISFWRESRWFWRQTTYPLQRFPRSCCVNREDTELIRLCSSVKSPFCDWINDPEAEDLCSGNIVLPRGIQWDQMIQHRDCFPLVTTYALTYATRSVEDDFRRAKTFRDAL
ncbi:hypothetical protein QR680_001963 [Steinernema hermaphroditum]|uniref:Uncharacterized protein n=1 Tax=Steinernema hermaphroditum TaxID=289476 RepID=A0AA39LGP3_9BILA|nr:hypothetical protein QR680_001963 [Steinernema hermaphroditum]